MANFSFVWSGLVIMRSSAGPFKLIIKQTIKAIQSSFIVALVVREVGIEIFLQVVLCFTVRRIVYKNNLNLVTNKKHGLYKFITVFIIFHSEERLVNLERRRERFVSLTPYKFMVRWLPTYTLYNVRVLIPYLVSRYSIQ